MEEHGGDGGGFDHCLPTRVLFTERDRRDELSLVCLLVVNEVGNFCIQSYCAVITDSKELRLPVSVTENVLKM